MKGGRGKLGILFAKLHYFWFLQASRKSRSIELPPNYSNVWVWVQRLLHVIVRTKVVNTNTRVTRSCRLLGRNTGGGVGGDSLQYFALCSNITTPQHCTHNCNNMSQNPQISRKNYTLFLITLYKNVFRKQPINCNCYERENRFGI